jgi:PKD repeat protein
MKRNIFLFLAMPLLLSIAVSCKKDPGGSGTKAVFSYAVDGFHVSFTNFSVNAREYHWDFGDGSDSSVKMNPTHTFRQKGDYLVKLTIRNGAETSTFTDTVLITGPSIRIDGEFADWSQVPYSHTNGPGTGGTIMAVKTFTSPAAVSFYVEGTTAMNFAVFDLYIDGDNNPNTGYATWFYPMGSGADILCEGNFNNDNPNQTIGSVFKHAGAPTDFSWDPIYSFAEVMKFSKMKTDGDKRIFEFSIQRKVFTNPNEYIHFGLLDNNSSYIEIGSIPASQAGSSKFSPIKL